ncbi:MAG: emp24/gp25L/p24 family protein [Chloroflexi bacterium]|nr:emp24/gp25L/p24 family protein [Chloroflexota bacterium]
MLRCTRNIHITLAGRLVALGVLSVSLLACAGPFAPARPTETPTTIPFRSRVLAVAGGSTETVEVAASAGETIFGWFEVRGEKAEIDFSVQGPDGSQVVAKNRYSGRYDFSFRARAEGNHKLIFDNAFAPVEKGVLVSYKISPAVAAR